MLQDEVQWYIILIMCTDLQVIFIYISNNIQCILYGSLVQHVQYVVDLIQGTETQNSKVMFTQKYTQIFWMGAAVMQATSPQRSVTYFWFWKNENSAFAYSINQELSEILSSEHFWRFTAKRCCRILLNKWSRRGFGVAENVIQVSGSPEIPNWFEKLLHPHQTPILLA